MWKFRSEWVRDNIEKGEGNKDSFCIQTTAKENVDDEGSEQHDSC